MKKLTVIVKPANREDVIDIMESCAVYGVMETDITGYGNQKGYRVMYRGTMSGPNVPMWKQYILYMENLMHGDLGISYKKNVSVNTLIARGFPYTLSIGLLSIAVSAFRAGSAWLVR